MASEDNLNLNLNAARPDKFFLRFGRIPSIELLTPEDATSLQKLKLGQDDLDYFHIALKTAQLPGVSLGEIKIDTMFTPLTHSDMKFEFQPLVTEMRLDSDYLLYKMLILWIFLIKHPETASANGMSQTFDDTTVTATLVVKDSFNSSVMSLEFYDLRPLAIPTIDLTYNDDGQEIILPIQWSYSYFMPKTGGGQNL